MCKLWVGGDDKIEHEFIVKLFFNMTIYNSRNNSPILVPALCVWVCVHVCVYAWHDSSVDAPSTAP